MCQKFRITMQIERDLYLKRLVDGMHNGLIKIVTGMRRAGKSYLLFTLFRKYLLMQGVDASHIIDLALDDVLNEEYLDPKRLVMYVRERITDSDTYYVLLDEVQMVDNFTAALNSLLHISNVDVYVTGSNSRFLSSDIATEFRGRGDETRVWPLTFAEYLTAYDGTKEDAWRDYCTYGGLPQIFSFSTEEKKMNYLRSLYQTVYFKDLVDRNRIKKTEEFDTLMRVMASSVGSPCNPSKLSNTFRSVAKAELSYDTISSYLNFMQDAFVVEKSMRYDIKGKKYIGTLPKYYFSDMGLRNALLDFRQIEETHIMENVIYNELRTRGFLVDVGAVEVRTRMDGGAPVRRQLEVDFVCNRGSRRYYIQSALALPTKEKKEQESASLQHITDSFKKIIVVKDNIVSHHDENGVLLLSLFDFLLKPDSLEL